MSEQKTILVLGATGAQGGSVANHLLARGTFGVRALTRNPDSENAAALKESGAEVVKGDLEEIGSIRAALEGCYGVFGVTNFWEHFGGEDEQGKNLVDAVADSDVEHFVYSTLPHVEKATDGELSVPHFDIKARHEDYARSLGLDATFVHVAFYYDNFLTFFPPQKQDGDTFAFGFPQGDTRLAGVAAEDIGGVVATIFERPEEFKGETVGVVGDDLTPQEYAETMTRVLGKQVEYNHIPRETFASFDFPGSEDLADMFDYNRRYIPNRQADLEQSRSLYPEIQDFESWLEKHQEAFQPVLQE